jgi:hypothetical protein
LFALFGGRALRCSAAQKFLFLARARAARHCSKLQQGGETLQQAPARGRDTAASSSKGARGEREEQCGRARGREGNILNKLVYFTTVQTCFISQSVFASVTGNGTYATLNFLLYRYHCRYGIVHPSQTWIMTRLESGFLCVALGHDGQGIYLGFFSLPVPSLASWIWPKW